MHQGKLKLIRSSRQVT